jgi:hypothetical protein
MVDARVPRWRKHRRFNRLWKVQLGLEQELRRAAGTSEEAPIRKQIDAVDEQRHVLAVGTGSSYLDRTPFIGPPAVRAGGWLVPAG